jgi:hypothetical protein
LHARHRDFKMPPGAARVPVTKAEAGVLADYVLGFK